jgi:hypothetical protein
MIKEKVLHKNEAMNSKLKIKPVHYSLTERAKKRHTLKILHHDEVTKKRRNLYQLLIFFEVFRSKNPVTKTQLFRFLKQVGISRNDLEIVKEYNASFPKVTHYKHIKNVAITKWIQSDSKIDSNEALYHITIPGFTIKEFASYIKKLRKGNEPRPFPSYTGITDVPFVLDTNYTKSEIADAIEAFRNDGLIKPITDIFPGEMRYQIKDESLVNFIKDVWHVYDIDLRILFEKLIYEGKPNDEDKKYLRLLYGKNIADRIVSTAHYLRKSYKQQNNKQEEKNAKKFIQDSSSYRTKLVQDIKIKYETVIKKYEILGELIAETCSSPFIQ